jgi:ADP-ribosyl-[dinitrogen reductase] hydrolase
VDTLECAVWAFVHTGSFQECLVTAVNLGGDADTIGAVAGALAGCYYGHDSIPTGWTLPLHEASRIRSLARELLALSA